MKAMKEVLIEYLKTTTKFTINPITRKTRCTSKTRGAKSTAAREVQEERMPCTAQEASARSLTPRPTTGDRSDLAPTEGSGYLRTRSKTMTSMMWWMHLRMKSQAYI